MGADLSKIALPDEDGEDGEPKPFILDEEGLATLDLWASELNPVLIVVDTVTAYIEGARDMNSANQTREWMRRLGKIARQRSCAVLILSHLNKNSNAAPLNRIMGSMDFVGASRSVLMVGHDPDIPDQRAIVHMKSNVGPIGPSLGFSILDGEFGWKGQSELDADRMCEPVATREARDRRDECAVWLREVLLPGPMAATTMEALCKEKGYSRRCYSDAKAIAGVKSERDDFGEKGSWQWRLV